MSTSFAYYTAQESEQFTFYRIPKALFTDPTFSKLSAEAKLLYGLMLDRMGLSRRSGWIDRQGRVYIYFTHTEIQYQIKQDKERLEKLQKRIQREQIKYEPARNVSKTYNEIDRMGQKTITGKMAISKEDYSELTALAKEGITSRAEISELEQSANYYRQKYFDSANALERMKTKYDELKEKCRPFLQALEHFPEVAKLFTEKVKQLFSFKEAQERAEKEAREKERQERIKARRNKRDMER